MFDKACLLSAMIVWSVLALVPAAAHAQTDRHVWPNGIDAGNCSTYPCASIGYALSQAASGDRIVIAAGEFNEMITIDKDIEIVGAGADLTILQPTFSLTDIPEGRVITINTRLTVGLSHLSLRRGSANEANELLHGGCIFSRANLSLINVIVQECRAVELGSGIYQSGGSLLLRNVVLRNNGWFFNIVGNAGGGLYSSGATVNATNVTIAHNHATKGGGISLASGSLTLSNSILGFNTGPDG